MIETITQIFGITFVCIIMICIGWTLVEYITNSLDGPHKRNQKLLDRANIAENEATDLVRLVEDDTKGILELGDQIAKRRERIQADRERVVANQRRTADLLIKLK